ncbi:MAG: imidazoleglycerol-phosphate dehydratase [Candidatus Hydrothermarchaeota archaeon]
MQRRSKRKEKGLKIELNLDGDGKFDIDIPNAFFSHILSSFSVFSGFDLYIKGDLENIYELTKETAELLGECIQDSLGGKVGIERIGFSILPMDDALILVSVDLGGRSFCDVSLVLEEKVGDFPTELVETFFNILAAKGGMNIHIKQLSGENTHHIIEATFKAFGKSLKMATRETSKEIPSTKGLLE